MSMRFETGQTQRTTQQLQLAPRIIQTMEIMQLPLPALEEKIEQELESNLALELAEPEQPEECTDERDEHEEIDETSEEFADLSPRQAAARDGRDPKLDAMANIRARQESLSEQLLHMWSFAEVTEAQKRLGEVLIGLIDADGFLTMPEPEMKKIAASELGAEPTDEAIDTAIKALQQWLEPPGIAAKSLHDSLMIQSTALALDNPEAWSDVETLIESHLEDLVGNRLPKVVSESGMSLDQVKAAMDKMHELTLSPGRLLATDRVLPVIPDAMIEYDDREDRYVVGVCDGKLPPLRLASSYETLVNATTTDERAKQFIHRNMNAARWIIEAVAQRKTTLGNIVQIVVERQRDFLDRGDSFLHPLPMVEVADMLGIHVATVSRAVADKWVQTPRGIFPLRKFFSGGTGTSRDGEMSWEAIKSRLKKIVDDEDKKKPLSDEAIAKKLQEQGIEIARRTVVKYRQQLGIAAARLRRQY
jgi:RNA polymerase sigma-54 factor